ncbi:MAG: DUF5654 family protein [Candidatus Woesearchaeota archaeon]
MAAAKLRKHVKGLKSEVIEKLSTLIITALGLVAALAWNSAIQDFFKKQAWLSQHGPWMYAVMVTLIAVLATIWIGRIAHKA